MALDGLAALASPEADQVLESLLARLAGDRQLAVVRVLGDRLSASSTTALADLIADEDKELAGTAADALRTQLKRDPGRKTRARQLAMTLDQVEPSEQLALLGVLAGAGVPDIAPPVAALLRSPDKRVRVQAMKALGELRGASACPCALAVLRAASDPDERLSAMQEALRLAALATRESGQEAANLYRQIAELARSEVEKQLIGDFVERLTVVDAAVKGGRTVEIVADGLRKEALVYTDRPYTYTDMPENLVGATYVKMAMEDKKRGDPDYFTVTVSKPATVYVGFDHRAGKPASWLDNWAKTGDALLSTDHGCRLELYLKSFPAGQITLGGNAAPGVGAHYVVVITE